VLDRRRGLRDNVLLGRIALGSLGEVAVGYGGKVLGAPENVIHSVRAWRGRAGWRGVRSTTCSVQRAAWHHADLLWAAAGVAVLVQEVREPQGRRGCVGWSHQFKRVSLRRAGRCWMGGQRLSWAAEARTAGGTWVITAHQHATQRLVQLTAAPIMTAGLCLTSLQAVLQVVGMDVNTTSPQASANMDGHMAPVGECG
jgi:hypothetical protein